MNPKINKLNKAIPKLYLSFVVALLSLSGCNSNHNALSKNSGDSPEIVLIDSLQNQLGWAFAF
jgi:hypothetical protein